jgi:hypothetical protein
MDNLKTCRFCGQSNFDYHHPAVHSHWVKYSTRCSAHLKCAIEKLGPAFLERLTRWQIEQLPFLEIRELGIEAAVRARLEEKASNA